ncbi:mechanosensitive ion channel [Aliiglaciecola sp. 2_MG-2023]|uniref:mechanosensitive ion channel family protein n=1 Tax=unclassified Aliiglaciecola TaxID=2593648 RepID=UPI0026E3C21A|nr:MULTISPECIES: mechanosensitive ion channel domain-containing protein [unclassified Aliiglaciecola]MDO6712916.1 mechanosensitive ion channel [Aliiglaciecola sp. 2_MG-2023]MDO6752848.1 mechanosensitive ion channel [Aliiglaciecola sp. 1_MG-2023]
MNLETISTQADQLWLVILSTLTNPNTYAQVSIVLFVYLLAFWLARKIRNAVGLTHYEPDSSAHPMRKLAYRVGYLVYPLIALITLKVIIETVHNAGFSTWLLDTALTIAVLLFYYSMIRVLVVNTIAAKLFKWVGLPILLLHLTGSLSTVIVALEDISLTLGNVNITAYGVVRVLIFGAVLFWLGRASNSFGKDIIRKQESIDIRTREVFSKLFEVAVFCIIALLLLNVMGINLTALAVFGGAVGVGLGLGLQSIASNFISGIIILLDRSLTVGDFVEMDDGSKGFVREFRMRYTVLETYDGKDILVPNEKFISNLMVNWTHKDPKQRYRVDFSVPYATDIRSMVEFIKVAVAEHPSVISGPDVPFEERPDCEIDSFGDSGVNMFVEFWMEGIDDGKNRVGGDLMLIIFETLRENGIEIPFPQREVRILNEETYSVKSSS